MRVTVMEERARRADAGVTRLMPRDAEALAWIGDMRAVEGPDLCVLLGRLSGREPLSPGGLIPVLRRWRALGLAEARRVIVGGPQIVTLTARGHERVGEAGRWSPVAWTQITHTTAVARARLLVEATWPPVSEWVSERRWRRENERLVQAGVHVPDAVVRLADDRAFAIEVEMTSKATKRTQLILTKLAESIHLHGTIYYVGSEAIARAVTAGVAEVERKARGRIKPIEVRILPTDLAAYLREHEHEHERES